MRPVEDVPFFPEPQRMPTWSGLLAARLREDSRRRKASRPPRSPYAPYQAVLAVAAIALVAAAMRDSLVSAWSPDAGRAPALAVLGYAMAIPLAVLQVLWSRWRLSQPYGSPRKAVATDAFGMLAFLVLLGVCLSSILRMEGVTHFPHADSSRWVEATPDGTGIVIASGIKAGIAERFEATLAATPGARTVYLWSEGGLVKEAYRIAAAIRRAGLDTVAVGYCTSACTDIHLAGRRRTVVDEGSTLGYHSISDPLLPVLWTPVRSGARQAYLDAGFNPSFVERVETVPAYDLWEPDAATLLAAGAIHGTVAREDVVGLRFLLRRSGDVSDPFIDKGWLANALAPAPSALAAIRSWSGPAWDAARNDLRVDRLRRAYAARVIAAGLSSPNSPDAAVRAAGGVLLDGMNAWRGRRGAKGEAECARIGETADLVAARRLAASASDKGDVPDARLMQDIPQALAALPAGWDGKAAPLPPVDAPQTWTGKQEVPSETCSDLVAWYEAATAPDDPDGPARLRRRLSAIASGERAERHDR